MCPLFFALCLLTAPTPALCAASPPPTVLIRIGLEKHFANANAILVSSDSAFTVQDALTGTPLLHGSPGTAFKISASPDGLRLTREEAGGDDNGLYRVAPIAVVADHQGTVRIAHPDDDVANSGQKAAWHQYRGMLTVSSAGDSALSVINTVPLEEYLYSVVPAEIGAHVPLEAMKAQAVAARTYALKNRGKCAMLGYDLDDTTHCEGYDGRDAETPGTIAAVDSTRGLVLTYHNTLIDAPYSTDSGGMTACEDGCPYLQAVLDAPQAGGPDYAADAKYHVWTLTYTPAQLQAALAHDPRTTVSSLTTFRLNGMDASGRITAATVTGDGVTKTVTGIQLRQILGYDVLRSTRVVLTLLPNGDYLFTGRGWGHGFGMSQEGAVAMALPPYRRGYRDILSHYYVGTTLAPAASVIGPEIGRREATPPRRGA